MRRHTSQAGLHHRALALAVAGLAFCLTTGRPLAAEAAGFRISAYGNGLGGGPVGCIARAQEIGLDGVEVGFGKPGDRGSLSDPEVQAACLKASQETGVALSSVSLDILNGEPLASSDTAERYVEECIAAAAKLKIRTALIPFFGRGDVKGHPEAIEPLVARLKRLAPKAEQAGVVLGLESRLSADELIAIMDAVGSPAVGVYYDVCNTTGEGYDVPAELRKLGARRLALLHMKENGTLLGHGRVSFRNVRQALDDAGYRGWLVIEGGVPSGAPLVAAQAHNVRFLRSIFPEGMTALSGAAGAELPFQLAVSQLSLARSTRAGQLAPLDFPALARKEFGVDAVDLATEFLADKLGDAAYLADLKKRCADAGVRILSLKCNASSKLGDPDEGKRREAVDSHLAAAKAAQALGCPTIAVLAQSRGDWDEQLERTVDGLRRLCDAVRGTGVAVLVENDTGQSANYAWLAEVLTRTQADNCGVMINFGSLAGYDTAAAMKALMPRAKAFTAGSRSFDGAGLETGSDYYAAVEALLAAGKPVYVSVEYVGEGMSDLDGTRATQRLLELLRVNPNRPKPKDEEPRVAQIDFGKRDGWKVVEVDSQETSGEDGHGQNVLDGNVGSIWHTEWSQKSPKHPHHIVIDLGQAQTVAAVRYLARQDNDNGKVGQYEVYVTDDPKAWGEPVAKGELVNTRQEQKVPLAKPAKGRYLVLKALSEVNGQVWTSAAEIGAILQ